MFWGCWHTCVTYTVYSIKYCSKSDNFCLFCDIFFFFFNHAFCWKFNQYEIVEFIEAISKIFLYISALLFVCILLVHIEFCVVHFATYKIYKKKAIKNMIKILCIFKQQKLYSCCVFIVNVVYVLARSIFYHIAHAWNGNAKLYRFWPFHGFSLSFCINLHEIVSTLRLKTQKIKKQRIKTK